MARPTKIELENRELKAGLDIMRRQERNLLDQVNEMRRYDQVREKRNAHLTAKLLAAQIIIFDQAQQIVSLRTKLADHRPADFILHDELSQMHNDFSASIQSTDKRE